MSSQSSRRRRARTAALPPARPAGGRRTLLVALFAAAAFGLGGAGVSYPLLHGGLLVLALAVLWAHLRDRPWREAAIETRIALLLALASLALPALQLIPLPFGLWQALPGHDIAARIAELAGPGGWRAWTLAPDRTLEALLAFLPAAAMLLAVACAPATRRRLLVRIVVVVAVASAVLAVFQLAAGPDSAPVLFSTTHRGFGVGLFVNRNHLALFLLAALPLSALPGVLAARPAAEDGVVREWAMRAGCMIVLSLGVLASLSRTGVFLLPLALVAAVLVVARGRPRLRNVVGITAAVAVGGAALYFTAPVQQVLGRFATAADDKRFQYWANTRIAVEDAWPLGTGFSTFRHVYPTVEPLNEVYPDVVNHAHNDLLELLLEGGIPAAALLAAWLAFGGWAFWRARRATRGTRTRAVPLVAAVGLVLALAASAVDYPFRMTAISVLVAMLAGLLLPVPEPAPAPHLAEGADDPQPAGDAGRALRGPGRVLAVVALGLLAVLAVATALAAALTRAGRPDVAVRFAPWSAEAQSALSTRLQLQGDAAGSSAAARRALAVAPLDAPALRAEGMAQQALGHAEHSAALLSLGARLGWREPAIQFWIVDRALAAGATAVAVQRIDALLRYWKPGERLLPLLPPLMATADGRAALADQLAFRPGWRTAFFNAAARDRRWRLADLLALSDALRRHGAPMTAAETALIRAALADAGDHAGARRVWQASGGATLLGDGGFTATTGEVPAWAAPYAWQAPALAGVRVEAAEPVAGSGGQAVSIYSDGIVQGRALAQTVVLLPGDYALDLSAMADDAAIVAGAGAELTCRDDLSSPGAVPQPLRVAWAGTGKDGWNRGSARFTVPAGCPLQQLAVTIPQRAGQPFTLWFDALAIRRLR